MEKQDDRAEKIRGLVQWATTFPQAIAVYFVCLVLVGGLSFYAGTFKPKHVTAISPPPVSAPRN